MSLKPSTSDNEVSAGIANGIGQFEAFRLFGCGHGRYKRLKKLLEQQPSAALPTGFGEPVTARENVQPRAVYAPKVTPYNGEDSTWVVFGDVHKPFHDEIAVEKLLWFLRMVKPDGVIANGDTLDFYALSSFSKDPRLKTDVSLNNELRLTRAFLRQVSDASGARYKIFHEGNHEARLQRYLGQQAPELSNIESPDGDLILTVQNLLELERHGWQHKEYHAFTTLGDLDVEHGENVSKPAAMPAGQTVRNVLIRRNRSTLINHIHTLSHAVNTSRGDGYFQGIENGCLCQLQPLYDPNARWATGWSVVTVRDGKAFVELVKMRDGKAFFRGEML